MLLISTALCCVVPLPIRIESSSDSERACTPKCERFVSSKNREQFAILTKQKTLTRYKSAFYSMKKGEQRSPFAEREATMAIFLRRTENFYIFVVEKEKYSSPALLETLSKIR
jgi:hypothetical protein